jgi:hypothetical protein
VKLAKAVRDHDNREHAYIAALHGVALQASHGQIANHRTAAMARFKVRRGH